MNSSLKETKCKKRGCLRAMKNLIFWPAGPSPVAVEALIHSLYSAGGRSLIIYVLSDAGVESENI